MAPCIYLQAPVRQTPQGLIPLSEQLYRSYDKNMDNYDQVGVYAYNGPDKEADRNKLCYIFGENNPECRRAYKPSGFG